MKTGRKFDREFKLKVVELSYQRENIKELAHEMKLRPELIYRWRSEFAALEGKSFPGNGKKKMTEEESEIDRLQKELADIRMERDILKKQWASFPRTMENISIHSR